MSLHHEKPINVRHKLNPELYPPDNDRTLLTAGAIAAACNYIKSSSDEIPDHVDVVRFDDKTNRVLSMIIEEYRKECATKDGHKMSNEDFQILKRSFGTEVDSQVQFSCREDQKSSQGDRPKYHITTVRVGETVYESKNEVGQPSDIVGSVWRCVSNCVDKK